MTAKRERVRPIKFERGPTVRLRGGGVTGSYLVTCPCGVTRQVAPMSYRADVMRAFLADGGARKFLRQTAGYSRFSLDSCLRYVYNHYDQPRNADYPARFAR